MKYRVILEAGNVWEDDRIVEVIAVSARNAKAIGNIRYKRNGYTATRAIRIGTELSTLQTMNDIRSNFISAMDEQNRDIAEQCEKSFYGIIAGLQNGMNVVEFNMAKKELPVLPPLH